LTFATYRVGSPARPSISHDNGFLDKFKPRAPTNDEINQYRIWKMKLEAGEALQGVPFAPHLPDALAAYRHFLDGSGTTRTINYERYTTQDSSGRTTLQHIITEAMNAGYDIYLKTPSVGKTAINFTGSAISCGGTSAYFPYPNSENWQKAIGAHSVWLSGSVEGEPGRAAGTPMEFTLKFTLHMEDMYNFNPGAKDIKTGIPDSDNGIFEVTGLAKQYMNVATLTRHVAWKGAPAKAFEVSAAPILRQRQPDDNRRARNRL
jgi:hypothetical protein